MGIRQPIRLRVAGHLRRRREALGLTQEQLAHNAGIAARHLQKIEGGGVNLTLRTIERLAEALRLDPAELFRPLEES